MVNMNLCYLAMYVVNKFFYSAVESVKSHSGSPRSGVKKHEFASIEIETLVPQ